MWWIFSRAVEAVLFISLISSGLSLGALLPPSWDGEPPHYTPFGFPSALLCPSPLRDPASTCATASGSRLSSALRFFSHVLTCFSFRTMVSRKPAM